MKLINKLIIIIFALFCVYGCNNKQDDELNNKRDNNSFTICDNYENILEEWIDAWINEDEQLINSMLIQEKNITFSDSKVKSFEIKEIQEVNENSNELEIDNFLVGDVIVTYHVYYNESLSHTIREIQIRKTHDCFKVVSWWTVNNEKNPPEY